MENQLHFDLGITCAGGGTGGAYIAGVLDYLFETLFEWEKAKQADLPGIPKHSVSISVMGGNSAGSISTALAVLNLYKNAKNYIPVTAPTDDLTGNLLYDSWVLLNNVGDGDVLRDLLKTKDLESSGQFVSVLNNSTIDDIAEYVHQYFQEGDFSLPPSIVSDDFEFIISMANLKGMPFEIQFKSDDSDQGGDGWWPSHVVHQHKLIAHFQPETGKRSKHNSVIQFSSASEYDRRLLLECAKSSGSLPFVFNPRFFKDEHFPEAYLKNATDKFTLFSSQQSEELSKLAQPGVEGEDYGFYTVDGGTFNNEPFGEVTYLLNQKRAKNDTSEVRQIMIDPYPNFPPKPKKDTNSPKAQEESSNPSPHDSMNVFQLLKPLYSALRGQGLFKAHELLAEHNVKANEQKHIKGMIFPSNSLFTNEQYRFDNDVFTDPEKDIQLASAPLGGLAGFVSKDFRKRDFFLGRYNCQTFLRVYFSISSKREDHELFQIYHEEVKLPNGQSVPVKDLFNIKGREENGQVAPPPLPIIPDMRFYQKALADSYSQKEYDYNSLFTPEHGIVVEMTNKCQVDEAHLDSYFKPLKKRIQKILSYGWSDLQSIWYASNKDASDQKSTPKRRNYLWLLILCGILMIPVLTLILPLYYIFVGRFPVNAITQKVLNLIKGEFEKVGMLVKKTKDQINLKPTQHIIIGLGLLTLLSALAMGLCFNDSFERTETNMSMILGLEFAENSTDVQRTLNGWRPIANPTTFKADQGLIKGLQCQVNVDYFFLSFYSLLFGFFAWYLGKKQFLEKMWKNRLFLLIGLLLSLTMFIGDLFENIQLSRILNEALVEPTKAPNYGALNFFTWLKWGSIGLIFLLFGGITFRKFNFKHTLIFLLLLIPFATMLILFIQLKLSGGEVAYISNVNEPLPTRGLQLANYNFLAIIIMMLLLYVSVIYERFSGKAIIKNS